MSADRPLIGVTGRRVSVRDIGGPRGFHDATADTYYSEYARAVALAGGIPVHLPLQTDAADLMEHLDGLLLTGGDDVDPTLYGSHAGATTTVVDPLRDASELELLSAARSKGVAVLGICRGLQLINVAHGGSLIADLPLSEGCAHASYAYPRAYRRHEVSFAPGSRAHDAYRADTLVNSFHHQAADRLGAGLVATGWAPDGIVEALESSTEPILAVQWHPECFGRDPAFDWLVSESSARSTRSIQNRTLTS
ncbi:gamma-glutamyl-gamma-aminobutyrate hydrolase family protein [Microbacterium trichothecenolyticum]|uniref:Glutamine amidotransferase n=1 Tax=Microbacterium trichothecenolyticum TaxID=69370 RepID=A0ABU0TQU1_MICTR|nr:gamma-glutamyl-gamma-aminobutyrate hydrolase family protein [Microbacterium trichothecenolyticum]MDQ1122015.1 putative glutamine amidotransferase [Microbacterium trichothecenolyticum]